MRLHPRFFCLLAFLLASACSPPAETPSTQADALIGRWSFRYDDSELARTMPKLSALAYDASSRHIYMAFEPVYGDTVNLLRVKFSPDTTDLLLFPPEVLKGRITKNVIRAIAVSAGGEYLAVGGRSRELLVLKNQQGHLSKTLDHEISALALGPGEILAVGDIGGGVTLLNLAEKSVIRSLPLLEGPVTSFEFIDENQLLASGADSRVFIIQPRTGEILRTLETRGFKSRLFHLLALKPCLRPGINQVLYVPHLDLILTALGKDFCQDNRIAVWDRKTGAHVRDFDLGKDPTYHMAKIGSGDQIAFVSHQKHLRTLSLKEMRLGDDWFLPDTFKLFISQNKEGEPGHHVVGYPGALIAIPNSRFLILGHSSLHLGATGAILLELTPNGPKHLAHLRLDVTGALSSFVAENLPPPTAPLADAKP